MSERLATQTSPSSCVDVDRMRARQRMAGGDADDELALGQRGELQRGRLGVGWPERRRAREDGEVERAGAQRSGERGRRPLAQGDLQLAGQRRQGLGHEPRGRRRERAEPDRARRRLGAGGLAGRGVELVEDPDRARQQAPSGRGEGDPAPAAVEQPAAGDGLERGHLAGDGRLGVAQRACRGRERARLRDLAQDPQPGGGEVDCHAMTHGSDAQVSFSAWCSVS